MADPVIKWVGGKRALLKFIRPWSPRSYAKYHEPFVGGGAVFFALEPSGGTLNDLNSSLINLYRVIRNYPKQLIAENQKHTYEEDYYYEARTEFNDLRGAESPSTEDQIREASLMIYLIQTGFNGLYRENNSGEFNVPFGEHSNPNFILEDRIHTATDLLERMKLRNEDFEYVQSAASEGDFVYFDPPYEPVSTTANFTQYQAEDFAKEDQRRLRDLAKELDSNGVTVLISNSPPVRELYEDLPSFETEIVGAPRHINSDADNRGNVAEVLIHNIADEDMSTLARFTE